MKDALIVSILSIFPRNHGARAMGWFARTGLSRLLTRAFVAVYQVNIDEAEGTLADYPTLEALFTRKLKPGVRPIDPAPNALVSPVDAKCAAVGLTEDGHIELPGGQHLNVGALLGAYPDGEREVAVLYLSPQDYHRVHVPREGHATGWKYVPGTLWPVFPAAVRRVSDLFSKNERCVVHLDTELGQIDVVLVGAFGVGRITLALCDLITNTGGSAASQAMEPPTSVKRGELLGTFHLGSTVVLVTPPGAVQWTIRPGDKVRLGTPIAHRPRQLEA